YTTLFRSLGVAHGAVHAVGQRPHDTEFQDDLAEQGIALFVVHQHVLSLLEHKFGYLGGKVHAPVLHLPGDVLGKEQQVWFIPCRLENQVAFMDDFGTDLSDLPDGQPGAECLINFGQGTVDHVLYHDHRADVEIDILQAIPDGTEVAAVGNLGSRARGGILADDGQVLAVVDNGDVALGMA